MGTGHTLALLPPQNATGNFVKIVQRLPVRVELTDYDPDKRTRLVRRPVGGTPTCITRNRRPGRTRGSSCNLSRRCPILRLNP